MARTTYPGLTKTENRRDAKHDYRLTKRSPERVCIVRYTDWCVTSYKPDGSVRKSYYVHHVKDAQTGELLDIDTRRGGYVKRRAPFQPSWVH